MSTVVCEVCGAEVDRADALKINGIGYMCPEGTESCKPEKDWLKKPIFNEPRQHIARPSDALRRASVLGNNLKYRELYPDDPARRILLALRELGWDIMRKS